MSKKIKIAIVGATGMVGRTFIKVLEEEKIQAGYSLFASERSAGGKLKLMDRDITILELNEKNVAAVKPDFALFSAGGEISKQFAPVFVKLGCVVIDNSSAFRQDPNIPLVVPEVNPQDIKQLGKSKVGIIANPNCSTIPAAVVLKPLDDLYGLRRVIYSTYQAVSGAGQAGLNDYLNKTTKKFPYQIFNNLIPHIDSFLPNGNTKEEEKMINETRKILHKPNLAVSATTVRVPIENCHSVSINAEFERLPDINQIRKVLGNSSGIVLYDEPSKNIYPMPVIANDKNEVFVGRIRIDQSLENTINMFVVSDNIRKGAATNAVQILKLMLG